MYGVVLSNCRKEGTLKGGGGGIKLSLCLNTRRKGVWRMEVQLHAFVAFPVCGDMSFTS